MTQVFRVNKQRQHVFLNRRWLIIVVGLILQVTIVILAFVSLQQAGKPDMTFTPIVGKPGYGRVTSVAIFTDAWINGMQPGMQIRILGPELTRLPLHPLNASATTQEDSHSVYLQIIDKNIIIHLNTDPRSVAVGNLLSGLLLTIIFSLTGITIYLRASNRPIAYIAYILFYCASIIFSLVNMNNTLWTHVLLYTLGLVTWGMATTFVSLLPNPVSRKFPCFGIQRIKVSPYTPLTIGICLTGISIPIILFFPWARAAISFVINTYTLCCVALILWIMFWGLRRLERNEKQMVRLIVVGIVLLLFVMRFNHNVVLYSSFVLNSFTYISTIYIVPLMLLPIVCGYALIRHQLLGTTSLVSRQVMRVLLGIFLASFFIVPLLTIFHVLESGFPYLGDTRYSIYGLLLGLSLWLFPLLWNKVRNIGDQVFYHDFYEYNRSLRELSSELTRFQHLDQICAFILPRLATLLHSTGTALIVRTQGHHKGEVSKGALATQSWRSYLNTPFISLDRLTSIANLALTHLRQRSAGPLLLDGILLLPLYDGDYLSGFLCVGAKLNFEPYSRQDKSFLVTLAAQLSMLEVNSRYLEHAQADAENLTALNRRVISAQEDERRHLALELHDEVLQQAMLLVRQLADAGNMTDVAEIMPLARSLVTSLRQTCLELRPPLLDELGLEEALSWLAGQTEQRSGREEQGNKTALHVDVSYSGTADIRLPADVELAFYRVVQEALSNVLKHAKATRVTIRLRYSSGVGMSLLICDNGHGFVKGKPTSEQLGLVGMHERMGAVNGQLQVRTHQGRGVIIRALYRPTAISEVTKEMVEVIE